MKIPGQIVAYALFMALVGFFSLRPAMRVLAADEAIVSVSFSLAGNRIGACRQLSQEEMNALPPNMRRPADCPRERHALRVEIRANDRILYRDILPPSGLWSDGESTGYQRIVIPAGEYDLRMSLDDEGSTDSFHYSQTATVNIAPGRNLVIHFDQLSKQFLFE